MAQRSSVSRTRKDPAAASGDVLQHAHARLVEAEACRRAGKLDRARSLCEALLKQYPDYVGVLQTLGAVHLASARYPQAVWCFSQAAMLCPEDWVNLSNLGEAYLNLGAREAAAQALQQAQAIKPDDPQIHRLLAELHRENRDYAAAAEAYRLFLKLTPSSADAAHGLGDSLLQTGDLAEGVMALKRAQELAPASVAILYSLSQLPRDAGDFDILGRLAAVRPQEGQSSDDFNVIAGLTRAMALDRLGQYAEAWQSLLEANAKEFPKHREAHRRNLLRMEAAYQAALRDKIAGPITTHDASQPTSLFIIGPSRAGKSTLERLVAGLGGVKRGFERRLIEPAVRRTSQRAGLLTLMDPLDLPRSLDLPFRESYLKDLQKFACGARIVTDTHPGMITSVGRIAATIPQVRFAFMRRNREDLALRILMRRYRAGNHYAYSIRTIEEYITRHDQLTDLWLRTFPNLAIAVRYEELVTQPQATLARVAELCGTAVNAASVPGLGDDRNCSLPYRDLMAKALSHEVSRSD